MNFTGFKPVWEQLFRPKYLPIVRLLLTIGYLIMKQLVIRKVDCSIFHSNILCKINGNCCDQSKYSRKKLLTVDPSAMDNNINNTLA